MYSQVGVILFSLIAMLSGARSYRQIHTLIDRRLALLNAAFPAVALRRAPAYTSVRGILQRLDPAELERAFRRHADGLDQACAATPSRFIAIDGKTLRQSFDAFADRKAAHLLSAFAVDHRIILAHEVIERDPGGADPDRHAGTERTGVHPRRRALSKTFEIARRTGNDLIVQVKDNQPTLLLCLEDIAATTAPVAVDDSRNHARNRRENRRIAVYAPGSALDDTDWGPLVAAVVRVERRTLIRSSATGQWTMRQETAFYASDSARTPST
ncbi:transposase family protein [Xanthobacter autotrophicus ATCC 700552]